ncbi:adenylate/guanylate cyclase domain-containing protein [Rhizobium cremeum]|uniref:adenylate/guanylate cyclase domain-containing protein n=1 Tax=Rhizobium cremeum TaxID=2813827 RepID=UPI001FD259A0|nr:adenylate/guanylate cyclase domain-containing protein [Rhizobium cremeum]MCJ7996187.1 adenylate/guanylate cyclase domain-containing protein [Rhizobium cremeum]MCJ8001446.1 adenylate/guanylate cyclase domain-containing protein [Rhizobium cremeum]
MESPARKLTTLKSISDAEIEAERALAVLRLFCALVLLAPHLLEPLLDIPGQPPRWQVPSVLALVTLSLSGLFSLFLIGLGEFRAWMRYLFSFMDAAMVAAVCYLSLSFHQLSGAWIFAAPGIWSIPLLLTVGALRYQPAIQIWSTFLFFIALVAVAMLLPLEMGEQAAIPAGVWALFSPLPSFARFSLLVLTGLASVVVMYRARSLLRRAQQAAYSTAELSRFLPPEVVPLVTQGDEWRQGRRQVVSILFVDIRNSTQIAEGLDPKALSKLIRSFRSIVQRASQANGGVIDKFIGDGAMLLFGVPDPSEDDAARSLNCARDILRLIDERNGSVDDAVRFTVGIGVHIGKVYCGIVGDDARREFTVIGDAVNVASRIEQATKQFSTPLLASGEAVAAAKEDGLWEVASSEPLRGRQKAICLMAPKAAVQA